MNIDYTKLNDRIVQQAYMALDKTQVDQMIQDKLDRAKILSESLKAVARGSKYPKSR